VVAHAQGKLVFFIRLEQGEAAYFAQVKVQAVARANCGQTRCGRRRQTLMVVIKNKGVEAVIAGVQLNVHIFRGISKRVVIVLIVRYGICRNLAHSGAVHIKNALLGGLAFGRAGAHLGGTTTGAAPGRGCPLARRGSIQNFHLRRGNFGFFRFLRAARVFGSYRTIFFHDIYVGASLPVTGRNV